MCVKRVSESCLLECALFFLFISAKMCVGYVHVCISLLLPDFSLRRKTVIFKLWHFLTE